MKFMNMKRFASTVMAGALTLSLAVPAFAADSQTVITATYAETALDVVVPANTNATINPYGLPVTMEDGLTTISGQPITIATPLTVQNQSSVALKMNAKITTTVETGMTLEAADGGDYDTNTAKELFVEFQAFETAFDGTTVLDPTKTGPAWAGLEDDAAALNVTLKTTAVDTAADGTGSIVLREGKDSLAQAGSIAFVRLSGKVAKKAAWAATDKLVATITYSFEPAVYTKSAGTIAGAGGDTAASADGGTLSVTLTPDLPTGVTVDKWEWSSSNTTEATVAALTDTTKATLTDVTGGTAGTVEITATGTGSDGVVYTSTFTFTTKAA